MPSSRREFLRTSGMTLAGALVAPCVLASTGIITKQIDRKC